MIILFLSIILKCFLVSGIKQETAEITCSHSIDTYNQILWYKQTKSGQLQLLGYMFATSPSVEPGVTVTISGNANKDQTCTLTIKDVFMNSSAVYFCAARYHSATCH
uniref:Ig-like domain-containing protein n=1 Tax=Pundamilia nyererei TaxID=303518 RepID=A0A3B4H9H6_9CICH